METLIPLPGIDITKAHFDQKRSFFDSGHTRHIQFRKRQLKALSQVISENEDAIFKALYSDLRKSESETYMTEIALIQDEIKHCLHKLDDWMSPEHKSSPLVLQPSSSRVVYEPKGVVLIISPWNFPFQLAMVPLIGAIAAGNCAVLKPSEAAPATAALIETLISNTFTPEYISTVQGSGHEVVPAMLNAHDFNHIFFTGSPQVGKIIARQAADKLTPTTLELGGKSPGIVAKSANVKVAARRLVFAKFTNAGQACVAPDYLLLHESIKDAFIVEAKKAIVDFYGDDPQQSGSYGRIVNADRFRILSAFISDGKLLHGGQSDAADLYIAPTIIDEVPDDSPVMQEEIFGPIWPVLTWSKRAEVLSITRKMRYPLAAYLFTNNKSMERWFTDNIEFGGGCINNAMVHFANPDLPFGGVMQSGSGNYHGWHGFVAFSHAKSLLKSATWLDPNIKYPPYGKLKTGLIKKFMG